jgi:hypothetical protein
MHQQKSLFGRLKQTKKFFNRKSFFFLEKNSNKATIFLGNKRFFWVKKARASPTIVCYNATSVKNLQHIKSETYLPTQFVFPKILL